MTNTIDATEVDVVQEQIDNLRDKRREVDALYTQLENSHRITKLVPDAFEHGACVQTWVNVGQETVNFKVTRGDDSVREIPFEELPEDAYEHGACVQTWVDVSQRDSSGSRRRWTVNFKVTRGDDSVREIPFEELPEEFINHLIKEKGIIGHFHSDSKKCGRTLLVEKLSKVKSRQWVKKRREQRQIS